MVYLHHLDDNTLDIHDILGWMILQDENLSLSITLGSWWLNEQKTLSSW